MENINALRPWFLRMLTDGEYVYTEQELAAWGSRLGIAIGEQGAVCLVVRRLERTEDAAWPMQLLSACRRAVKNLGLTGHCCISDHMDTAVLLTHWEGDLRTAAMRLQQTVSRYLRSPVRLGIGSSFREYMKAADSKTEACEALGSADESLPVADVKDVYRVHAGVSTKAAGRKAAILEQFRRGRTQALAGELEALAETVRSRTVVRQDAPYPTSIRRTMVELLVEFTHIAADAGVDVDAIMGFTDPYRRIFELRSTPEIIEWVVGISNDLGAAMAQRKSQAEGGIIEKARDCIARNLADPDLSLTTVSEVLGLSPAYFSNFFIRETGEGFKDHVNRLRLARAKELLGQPGLRIGQVAEMCGFQSESYFISFFKKHTGASPGKFRKK